MSELANQRARKALFTCVVFNKLTSVFYASVLSTVIDHEFRHNIVKVADYFDNVMTKFIVNNRTDALKTDINLFFMITKLSNCLLLFVDASHKL